MLGDEVGNLHSPKKKPVTHHLSSIGKKLKSYVIKERPAVLKNISVLISKDIFEQTLKEISKHRAIALDTETTGLYHFHGDAPFSLALSTPVANYYFNFHNAVDIPASLILDRSDILRFQGIIDAMDYVFIQNAKFDMHHMRELDWSGVNVYCTEVMGRLINNERKSYSLANQALLIGYAKDDTVEKHIKTNKLYEDREKDGKSWKQPRFDKVPFQMIATYAMIDAEVCLALGLSHLEAIKKIPTGTRKNPMNVLHNEVRVTRTLYDMEETGVLCDTDYTRESLEFSQSKHEQLLARFKGETGLQFLDSALVYARVFHDTDKSRFVTTAKGNLEFSKAILKTFEHPAAKTVMEIRKLASDISFFKQFLFAADANSVIHTDYRQPGTRTARYSSRNPNLQNLKKKSDNENDIEVKRCLVPRPGFRFFMLDYDQMEYRMMLDYAGATRLIGMVLDGLDVHSATGELARINRDFAKAVNFGTLYGQGMDSLAASLGTSPAKAKKIQDAIFSAAPEIKMFIEKVQDVAVSRRVLYNWAGRPYRFPYRWMKYKAPNTVIQGGAAEVLRFAMPNINDYLRRKRCESKMLLNIHDELDFEIKIGEEDIIPDIKRIMETTYPHKHLPLTCSVEYSAKSLADKEPWDG